jgi:glycosyltransferase involved in cell wall biosynthesis
LRIAVNTRFLLKDRLEGLGRVTYEITKRLVEQHPEDEFLFFFDRPYDPSFVFADNVHPIVLSPPARHPILWYIWFEWSVARALQKYKPDVFFSPDNYLSLGAKTPTVMVNHDIAHVHYPDQIPPLVMQYYKYFVPRFLQKANQVITVSDFVRRDLLEQYPMLNAQKIKVAHNACSEDFTPVSAMVRSAIKNKYTQGQDYFFYIGSIHPRKNIERLIRAFGLFKAQTKSSMKLVLGGRLAWKSEGIQKALRAAEIRADIVQTGFIDNAELPKLLGSASALVFVSLFEGFGLPILEAMHADVPVITSNIASMPEVAGEAALLVDPRSVEDIAKAMTDVLEPTTAQQLVAAGRIQREKFSWARSTEIVYSVLRQASQASNTTT